MRNETRGGAYVEHLIAMMPVLTFAMCIFQESVLFTGQVLTEHAALAAARAASVVLPDAPSRYGGEAPNKASPQRTNAVRLAAIRALAPLVLDENVTDVQVAIENASGDPKAQLAVRVDATLQCKVPLATLIVCESGGTRRLSAEATLPNQGARYTYED